MTPEAAFVQAFLWVVGGFFVLYLIGYATFLFLSVSVGASILNQRKREARYRSHIAQDCYVPVTIIVPAHNEGVTIVESVRSLMSLDYKLYEVIVVDDGSTDDTAEKVIEAFGLELVNKPIRLVLETQPVKEVWMGWVGNLSLMLVRKENGGKSDALNVGINASRFPYFICIDADSMLQRDSLREIVEPVIEDDTVVAVGGLVRPANGIKMENGRVQSYSLPRKIVPAMQVLEYDRSFLSARILLDQFNGNLIISGAFGLFRKDLVIAMGGYDANTVGEDMELVTRMHVFCRGNEIPYRIRYAPDAICWSQAPETLRDLIKQRRRWHTGLYESMTKHGKLFANLRYGPVAVLSYTYFLIYELFQPAIELFGLVTVAIAFAFNFINVPFMIMFFFIYALYGAVMSLTAFFSRVQTRDLKLTPMDVVRALILALFEVSVLRFILAVTRMLALVGYRKHGRRWETVQRTELNANDRA